MDDIIVYSPTIHEHLASLTEVFKCLRSANIKIEPDKCEFLLKRKKLTIVNFPQSKNKTTISGLLDS